MTSAARQALGGDAVVLVEELPALPTSDEAASRAERDHAADVVEVDWPEATHTHATVRVHAAGRTDWAERDLTFAPADPPDERGRTIGFAIASLIRSGDEPSPNGATPSSRDKAERPPDPTAFSRVMIDAAGVGTLGGASGTDAAGAEIAGLVVLHPRIAAVAIADVRLGDIPSAQSTFSSVQLGGGAAWRALVSPARRSFELDLHADILATFLRVSHYGQTQAAWQPGARVAVEAAWFPLGPRVGFLALAGGEAVFGNTSIVIGTHTVATVFPVRAVGEVGLRARF
jgi:hypothetical protein